MEDNTIYSGVYDLDRLKKMAKEDIKPQVLMIFSDRNGEFKLLRGACTLPVGVGSLGGDTPKFASVKCKTIIDQVDGSFTERVQPDWDNLDLSDPNLKRAYDLCIKFRCGNN